MAHFLLGLGVLAFGVLTPVDTVGGEVKQSKTVNDWSLSASRDSNSIQLSANGCYDDPGRAIISVGWYYPANGGQEKSGSFTCGCGETLHVNDLAVTHSSITSLLATEIPIFIEDLACTKP